MNDTIGHVTVTIVEQPDLFGKPSLYAVMVDGVIVTEWRATEKEAWDDFNWARNGTWS